ncbi:hypothetical protein [Halobiforma nitratireducens]|uniref:Uncharacterized protein n=1 Tax=Halobiforma nitratireducens JCM 10879 TaxID=1227454 RepID=M0LKR1_9EURY|nr:hypothetical protein [Halobiforma nitratireducens]EMA34121.1 hypothetical protein C446_13569 [Halobiforma nitratireducens JCM 10879]
MSTHPTTATEAPTPTAGADPLARLRPGELLRCRYGDATWYYGLEQRSAIPYEEYDWLEALPAGVRDPRGLAPVRYHSREEFDPIPTPRTVIAEVVGHPTVDVAIVGETQLATLRGEGDG